jgi:peptidyl-prolyl cis-trans isomerase C
VKPLNWKLSVAFVTLSTAWSFGQSQQAAVKPKPDATASQATPAGVQAGTEVAVPEAAPDAIFPAVVARVNGNPIPGRSLEERVQAQLSSIGNPAWKNLREDYRLELTNNALGAAVAEELIYEKATASGVKVSVAEVQTEYQKVANSFTNEAAMNAALADSGLNSTILMSGLERNLVVSKYINDTIKSKVTVTPEEAEEYYKSHTDAFRHPEMVRTSHILITVAQGASADEEQVARQRAQAILDRARKGEDFAKLAKESSMDSSASQGGDIGYFAQGQLDPAYEAVAFSLEVGALSDLVRSRAGYHIVKVTDIKKEGLATFDESRAMLMDWLKSEKANQQLQVLVDQLRKEAKIEILIDLTSARPGSATASSPRP